MKALLSVLLVAAVLPFTVLCAPADDPCVSSTLDMVGVCGTFVNKVQNDAKNLTGATDEQIKAAAAQGAQPSQRCCSVYHRFLENGCNCDAGVLSLAASQQTDAAGVATQTRIWKASCGFDNSLDKCPFGTTATANFKTLG